MSNLFWYRHTPHHGGPRTGSGALSLVSPGVVFILFSMLLFFAPRIALGFLAGLLLLIGGVLLYIGITFWRIKKDVLKDFESLLNRTGARTRFEAQPGHAGFHFSHMRSTEGESAEIHREDYDSAEMVSYEIDVDSIEVLNPEPDYSGKGRRRWYRLH